MVAPALVGTILWLYTVHRTTCDTISIKPLSRSPAVPANTPQQQQRHLSLTTYISMQLKRIIITTWKGHALELEQRKVEQQPRAQRSKHPLLSVTAPSRANLANVAVSALLGVRYACSP